MFLNHYSPIGLKNISAKPSSAIGVLRKEPAYPLAQSTISKQAIRRPLETNDIVGAVLFLASDHSKMTTGQTIMVDGGTVFL